MLKPSVMSKIEQMNEIVHENFDQNMSGTRFSIEVQPIVPTALSRLEESAVYRAAQAERYWDGPMVVSSRINN